MTSLPEANAERLVRKTFAAMVNDAILSLYDPDEDLYLLVSNERVLEPYLRKPKGTNNGFGGAAGGVQLPPPFFVRSVPRKRISHILSWIESTPG